MGDQAVVSQQSSGPKFLQALPAPFRDPQALKVKFDKWTATQPVAIEAAVSAITGSFQGGLMGGVMGSFLQTDPTQQMNQAAAQTGQSADMLKNMQTQMGGPWIQARNFAVITGVHAGIATAVRRIRKKDDTYTAMIAAFGSGVSFSLVSGITQGNRYQGAFTTGVMFAAFQGGIHKLGTRFSAQKKDPMEYVRARTLLTSLGFPEYAKNIQKGRLNDTTIWLWDDRALRDVRIPPGPRLLILNHVDRYRNALKPPAHPPRMPQQNANQQK